MILLIGMLLAYNFGDLSTIVPIVAYLVSLNSAFLLIGNFDLIIHLPLNIACIHPRGYYPIHQFF